MLPGNTSYSPESFLSCKNTLEKGGVGDGGACNDVEEVVVVQVVVVVVDVIVAVVAVVEAEDASISTLDDVDVLSVTSDVTEDCCSDKAWLCCSDTLDSNCCEIGISCPVTISRFSCDNCRFPSKDFAGSFRSIFL